ncbi:Macrophage migration inhibitory factor (MIF), putative [Entamoeba histolytica]|uniref:L-dopachrome isomerase n=1 Tax=Entamoeba histolytica HM-1:IMSS-A TaxID=885318 RepID=N9TJT9_ENTH1|nr:macrophage migration inhibitory factor family protein, putative [Entamoeba histolytica HM-1:IMSS-A]
MPHALITLSADITEEIKKEIAHESMKILSEVIGKPISYCATQVVTSVGGFGGKIVKSAFIDIKSIGGLKGKQEGLSDRYCKLLEQKAGIEGGNIYLNFTEMTGNNWGYDHSTF